MPSTALAPCDDPSRACRDCPLWTTRDPRTGKGPSLAYAASHGGGRTYLLGANGCRMRPGCIGGLERSWPPSSSHTLSSSAISPAWEG